MEDRLKKLVAIIDYGSFTAAAQALHTSQPALTISMQKLERELKQKLLQRKEGQLVLTNAGTIAYEYGKQLQTVLHNMQASLGSQNISKQHFTLGSIDSIAQMLSSSLALENLEEQVELSLLVHSSSDLLTQLKYGRADAVIVVRQKDYNSLYEVARVGDERFVVVSSPEFSKNITLKKLRNFLAYNQTSTTFTLIANQLAGMGYDVEPSFYSSNPSVILQHALRGKGICALPYSVVENHIVKNELVMLEPPGELLRPIDAIWHKDRIVPYAAQKFISELKNLF